MKMVNRNELLNSICSYTKMASRMNLIFLCLKWQVVKFMWLIVGSVSDIVVALSYEKIDLKIIGRENVCQLKLLILS